MRRRRRTAPKVAFVAVAVGCGFAAHLGVAHADVYRGCSTPESRELARLIAIDRVGASFDDQLAVVINCRDGRFDIEVHGSHGAKVERTIDLQQTPTAARPRLVAIVVVELVAASAADEAAAAARVRVEPTRREAPSPTPEPIPPCCLPRIQLVGGARLFDDGLQLLGGGIRAASVGARPLAFDLLVEYGAPAISEGSVSLLATSAGITYGWRLPLGTTAVRAAAGARGGAVLLRGRPSDPGEVIAASHVRGWGGPIVETGVAFAPLRAVVLDLVVEGGYALFPAYALVADRRETGLRGVWVGARLGVGLAAPGW